MTKQIKLKPGMLKADGELDLTNPDLVAHLKDSSVTDKPIEQPLDHIEESQIKDLESIDQEVVIHLSKDQISGLMRRAQKLSLDWKEYLQREIQEQLFTKNVGQPLITKPSWATKQQIQGPSGVTRRLEAKDA